MIADLPIEWQTTLLTLFEGFVLIGFLIYLVFALVVVRQTRQMTDTLEVGFEAPIRFLAWVHLFVALATFAAFFVLR